jgi:fido (protein-threonine AMPylation protein)
MAQAASAFVRFMKRQNPKGYIFNYGDLKDWHRTFFGKIVPVPYYAGNFRGIDPSKPCLDGDVHVNGVFGAAPANVESLMKNFSDELARATIATDEYVGRHSDLISRIHAATQLAAFAGGTVIKIHPFLNGNGRMARLIMNFHLHRYLGEVPFYVDRPSHPNYGRASTIAMQSGNFIPLRQYLIEVIASTD